MSTEKIQDSREIRHWPDHMETDYLYTLGIAGERFFQEIKKNGKIMGAKCKKCSIVYVPPRMYCEKCFNKLEEWMNVGTKGVIQTYTVAHIDLNGDKLEKPMIYAMVKIDDTDGGLIHKVEGIAPEKVRIGMKVEAVFKPKGKREGSINDISHFKPAK